MIRRLLLVDDEVEFTAALTKVLRRRGWRVDVCRDGNAALETLAHVRYAVVVLDVKMPGPDGLEVLAATKKMHPDTEVILMTGHLSPDEEQSGITGGAAAYLLKPHPIPDLVARIEAAARRADPFAGIDSLRR